MSYCTECGKRLEEGEQKCNACGKIAEEIIEDNNLNINNTQLLQDNRNINFFCKLKNKSIIIISVVVLCLILGVIGIVKYTNTSKVKEGLTLGNKYLQEGKYEEAILSFKKVIQVDPKNIEARVGLAKVYTKIEKFDEAEKMLKEAISVEPKNVEPYLELARLYVSKNNPASAIKILIDGYKATSGESIKSMLEELKSKITVDNINKTITLGENFSLPKEVAVKINNAEVKFPVKWDKTAVDKTKAGAQIFTGTLENIDKVVRLTLNVITIASVEDINSTVNQNDKYSLPSKVTAKMTDASTNEVEVTWNPSNVDTSKSGNYSYQGSVSGYNSKVKLNLKIHNTDFEEVLRNLLGQPMSKLKEKFGECISKTTYTRNNTEVQKYSDFTVSYNISDNKIFSFSITNPKIIISGINCGMSGDKVINKLGKPKYIIDKDDFGTGIRDYSYIYDNIQFFFNNESFDSITQIAIFNSL